MHGILIITATLFSYDRQHKNKAEYLRVKTKTDINMSIILQSYVQTLINFKSFKSFKV
jgi:hypothetical protein